MGNKTIPPETIATPDNYLPTNSPLGNSPRKIIPMQIAPGQSPPGQLTLCRLLSDNFILYQFPQSIVPIKLAPTRQNSHVHYQTLFQRILSLFTSTNLILGTVVATFSLIHKRE